MSQYAAAGFAARELSTRIRHAEPKVIISASCGVEPSRLIRYGASRRRSRFFPCSNLHALRHRYKPILDQAIALSGAEPKRCIIFERPGLPPVESMQPGRDVMWDEALGGSGAHDCVPVEANQAMYILYTSGTTGKALHFLQKRLSIADVSLSSAPPTSFVCDAMPLRRLNHRVGESACHLHY